MENGIYPSDIYPTKITPLAAYLITEGFDEPDTDFSNPSSVVFLFKNDSAELEQAVLRWKAGRAEGNINTWHDNYRKLLARISRGF